VAYIYPEQAFKSGEVMDSRDFNRNAGQYAAEISQIDRDNLQVAAITDANLEAMSITSGGLSATKMVVSGPCNRFYRWISDTTQAISDVSVSFAAIDNLGGTISTLDSVLVVELSLGLEVDGMSDFPDDADHNHYQVYLYVDGVTVDTTGSLGALADYNTIYLCGSTPVGAGDHTVTAKIRAWAYDPATDVFEEFTDTVNIYERELIVRELRR